MRKYSLLLLVVCLFIPSLAFGQTGTIQGSCTSGGAQAKVSGLSSTNYLQGVIPSCTVTVYLHGSLTKATIYSDGNNTPLSNPFTANAVSSVNPGGWLFWVSLSQGYDVVMSGGIPPNTFSSPVTITNVFANGAGGGGGSGITQLVGDVLAGPGSGSVTATLATVNSNVGSFGSSTAIPNFTVNAKGLITAAGTNPVIAPAGTLTGNTLAPNVIFSSLTSLGTITTGVWNGTPIGIPYGGTGLTAIGNGCMQGVSGAITFIGSNCAGLGSNTFTGTQNAPIFNATTSPYFEVNGVQLASTNLSDTANIAYLNATSNRFTGSLSALSFGKYFYQDGFPSSCTVNGVNYTTQLDCAFYTAALYASTNGVQVLLWLSPGIDATCAGLMEPIGSNLVNFAGVSSHYVRGSVIRQTCSTTNATVSTALNDTTFAGNLILRDLTIDSNLLAPMALLVGQMQALNLFNVQFEGAAGTTAYAQFGSTWGSVYELIASGVTVKGNFTNSLTTATVTTNVVGGTIDPSTGYTVTSGGSHFLNNPPQVILVGHGAGNNQPCAVMPTNLRATMTGSAGNYSVASIQADTAATGCQGTITTKVLDVAPAAYALYLYSVTDSHMSDVVMAGAGRQGSLRVLHGNNTFDKVHPYFVARGIYDSSPGLETYDHTEIDTILDVGFEIATIQGALVRDTTYIFNTGAFGYDPTSTSVYWLANNTVGGISHAAILDGLSCTTQDAVTDFQVFLNPDQTTGYPLAGNGQAMNMATCSGASNNPTLATDFHNNFWGIEQQFRRPFPATATNTEVDSPHIILRGQHYSSGVSNDLSWDISSSGRGVLQLRANANPATDSLGHQVSLYDNNLATSSSVTPMPPFNWLANCWNGTVSTQCGYTFTVNPSPSTGTSTTITAKWAGKFGYTNNYQFGDTTTNVNTFTYGVSNFAGTSVWFNTGTATNTTNYPSYAQLFSSSVWDATGLAPVAVSGQMSYNNSTMILGHNATANNVTPGFTQDLRYSATSGNNYNPPGWQSCGRYYNSSSLTVCQANNYSLTAGSSPTLTLLETGGVFGANYSHWIQSPSVILGLGSATASNTPSVDFHSINSSNTYDVRMVASGGTSGTSGQGVLNILASTLELNGVPIGTGSGTITPAAQYSIPIYSAAGTASTLSASPSITTNSSGNLTLASGGISQTASNTGIELGSTSASNTPYIDFHSSGFANDYDTRVIASGGSSGFNGLGILRVLGGFLVGSSGLTPGPGTIAADSVTTNSQVSTSGVFYQSGTSYNMFGGAIISPQIESSTYMVDNSSGTVLPTVKAGVGAPSSAACTGSNIGSIYLNVSGGASSTFYVCTSSSTWTTLAAGTLLIDPADANHFFGLFSGGVINGRLGSGGSFTIQDSSATTKFLVDSSGNTSVSGTLTVNSGGVANKAICWKSASILGYCSTQPDSTGACTCN